MDYFSEIQKINKNHVPRYDFHMHTKWTDGQNSSKEMYDRAIQEGLEFVLFSEHARKSSADWFIDFAKEIRSLPESDCHPLVGVESKVDDFDGNIDATDKILNSCDLVMASVHRFPGEKGIVNGTSNYKPQDAIEIEMKLSLAVLENKAINILGHPFGMSYRRFNVVPSEENFRKVIEKASKTGVAIEINPHYHPDPWRIIKWCKDEGAKISIGSNAHEVDKVGYVTRVLEGKEFAWNM